MGALPKSVGTTIAAKEAHNIGTSGAGTIHLACCAGNAANGRFSADSNARLTGRAATTGEAEVRSARTINLFGAGPM